MPLKSADTLDLLTDVKSAAVDRWHPEMHLKMNGGILSLLYQLVKRFLPLSSFRIWWTQYSFFLISCFMKLENHKIIVICSTTLFHFFYSEFWQHVWRFFFFFFFFIRWPIEKKIVCVEACHWWHTLLPYAICVFPCCCEEMWNNSNNLWAGRQHSENVTLS